MASTIAQMTKREFAQILSTIVEEKLIELYGDPDEGLVIKERLRKRLTRQRKSVAKGVRGASLDSVIAQLGLD